MKNKYNKKQANKIKKVIKKVIKGILFGILGAAVAALLGFVIMWLWNKLITDIFSLRDIAYWEAVGLFILAKIFFGGFGSSNHSEDKTGAKKEISNEIDKELDKELDKEFDITPDNEDEVNNDDYDKLYEEWWKDKGENSFSEYMNDSDNKE